MRQQSATFVVNVFPGNPELLSTAAFWRFLSEESRATPHTKQQRLSLFQHSPDTCTQSGRIHWLVPWLGSHACKLTETIAIDLDVLCAGLPRVLCIDMEAPQKIQTNSCIEQWHTLLQGFFFHSLIVWKLGKEPRSVITSFKLNINDQNWLLSIWWEAKRKRKPAAVFNTVSLKTYSLLIKQALMLD